MCICVCTAGAHRHGLQNVGKAARRMPPPANLPSLKSEYQRTGVLTAPPPINDNTGLSVINILYMHVMIMLLDSALYYTKILLTLHVQSTV